MINNPVPCKNCIDRTVSCHSTCKRYINYRNELDSFNDMRRKEKKLNEDFYHGMKVYDKRYRFSLQKKV